MDKPSVYIETSIVSYLAARPSRDPVTLRNQRLTHEWWNEHRERYALYTSDAVIEEAAIGDPLMAQQRLLLLTGLDLLRVRDDSTVLADELRRVLRLPARAATDALHIALAAVYGMGYVLTWNCRHIANPALRPRMERTCNWYGYMLPVLTTPRQLMGD
jgi:predicted nucleic acid-binding protein